MDTRDAGQDRLDLELRSEPTRTRFEQLFRYAQVGRCVNGATHDINNALGAIMAYTELIGLDEGLSSESRRMAGEVLEGVQKCSSLINYLTEIARKEKPTPMVVEPCELASQIVLLRGYTFKVDRIQLETDFGADIPSMLIDLPQIKLALIYLLMNAQENLVGAETKRIRLAVKPADQGVAFIVWDSGPAVPEDLRARIFESYFTTKSGEHFGLGLSMARKIADAHRGSLEYDPERGFILYIPHHTGLTSTF
jgi:signal transduction histidine kinase